MPGNNKRMRAGRVALVVLVTAAIISLYLQRYGSSTLAVDQQAIRSWLDGAGLYTYRDPGTRSGTALPPTLALLLTPLALLPLHPAGWLLALAATAALLLVTLVVAGPVARRHGRRRIPFVLGIAALALLSEPVRASIGLGRSDLLILALIAADLVALRRAARLRHRALTGIPGVRRLPISRRWSRPGLSHPGISHPVTARSQTPHPAGARSVTARPGRARTGSGSSGPLRRFWARGSWAGIGIGLATTLSATSLLFVVHLLITGQRRAAGTALATSTAAVLAALVIAPAQTLAWYGTTMWELDRPAPISDLGNQSLAAVMARLYGFPAPPVLVWFSFGILLLAVGLIRARAAHADGDEVAAFTLIGLTIAVSGPVTTAAESLWILPAVLILADTGLRRRRGIRLPRTARLAGTWFLVAAALAYLTVVATPDWSLAWNLPAIAMILLVNILPSRHASPPLPTPHPARRRVAIPLPRGG